MIHWTLTLCSLVLVKSDCIRFRRKSPFFLFGVIYDLCCDFNLWYFQSLYCKTFIHLVVFTSCLEFLIVTFYAAQSATSSSVGWSCRSDFWVKPTRDTWKFVEARLRAEFSYLVLAARIRNQTLDIWVRLWECGYWLLRKQSLKMNSATPLHSLHLLFIILPFHRDFNSLMSL